MNSGGRSFGPAAPHLIVLAALLAAALCTNGALAVEAAGEAAPAESVQAAAKTGKVPGDGVFFSRPGHPDICDDLGLSLLDEAIRESLDFFDKLPPDREYSFCGRSYTAASYKRLLSRFAAFVENEPSREALQDWVEKNFIVCAAGAESGVLYTGYYMPVLSASREPTGRYRHPVYSRPDDLITFRPADFCENCPEKEMAGRLSGGRLVPYYSRKTIEESGVLEDTAEPIVWMDDPVDLFFLHIQGSAMVRLREGGLISVRYAASNGRPYKSIGKYMIDSGKISKKDLTMGSLRGYLQAHPQERRHVLAQNPRYIFFQKAEGGPRGSLGQDLTPGRSVAMDKQYYPPGVLAWIRSRKPVPGRSGSNVSWQRFSRFVLHQDSGGAICGSGRVDIYWGGGSHAAAAAGRMKEPGSLYILLPRQGQ
ncbi:MAG: murein transglycosylase A [Desulfosalsimonadaceae bacterium]